MKVIVNKRALIGAIVESLSEEEGPEFERIDVNADASPIQAVEMMSTQLAEVMPPVDDPDFIPATTEELSRSAFVIGGEVPETQIEFFYRKLHEILDQAIDRENERNMKVESLKKIVDLVIEGGHDGLDYEFDPDSDSEEELSAEDLIAQYQKQQGGQQPPPAPKKPEPKEEVSDEEISDEDLPEDKSKDYYIKSALQDFIDKIIAKKLHIVQLKDEKGKVQTAPMIKMDNKGQFSLMDEPMTVLASENSASDIIQSALNDPETSDLFGTLVRNVSKKSSAEDPSAIKVSYVLAISELSEELGKEGDPVDEETAAIMAANNMADTMSKSAGVPKFGPEISEIMAEMADDAESSGEETVQASSGSGRDVITREVPLSVMVSALRTVSEERKEKPRRGRPKAQTEEVPLTPEEAAGLEDARELAEIEKNMKSLTANSGMFGFSGAAGLRQWMNKFPLMAWTIMMGEEKGSKAFQGYSSLISGYMLTLVDNFTEKVIPAVKSGIERDEDTDEEEKAAIFAILDDLVEEFEEMQESAQMSEEEEIDPELLLGDFAQGKIAGPVLRNAIDDLFKKEDLMKLSKHIEKEMIPYLESEGLDKKAATKLAHMFNGRVKMVNPVELKRAQGGGEVSKSTQNVASLGIGIEELTKAQKKVSEVLESWFSEDAARKRKQMAKEENKKSKFSRDKIRSAAEEKLVSMPDSKKESERIKFLADLLDDAINAAARDAELEAELEAKKIPKSKR